MTIIQEPLIREEPDSGDIDDGDHGHDHGNKDNAGDKQQDQVGLEQIS